MMSFLAPAALGAAVCAALPIAIHLLSSRAATQRSFPALAFLRRAHAGTAKRGYLRDFLVLMARMLLVLALVGALAAPVLRLAGGAGAPVVVIVDGSASMQQRHLGATAWEHAVAIAARLGDELAERPVVGLVAGTPLQRSSLAPTLDRGAFRALLATARPGWGAGSNDQALALALGLLTGGGDIFLVADGSRGALSGIDPQAMPPGVVLHLVDAGGGGDNQGVRAIALEPGVAVAGRPCTVRGEVVNHGGVPATLTVGVSLGDDRRTRTITVPA
ncbi:MAG TPA: VWA domain-containing protein, partial [Planctomycetota bacterium]|nr:VWA domain-containing protein [Planctomycetota bacterium]